MPTTTKKQTQHLKDIKVANSILFFQLTTQKSKKKVEDAVNKNGVWLAAKLIYTDLENYTDEPHMAMAYVRTYADFRAVVEAVVSLPF